MHAYYTHRGMLALLLVGCDGIIQLPKRAAGRRGMSVSRCVRSARAAPLRKVGRTTVGGEGMYDLGCGHLSVMNPTGITVTVLTAGREQPYRP